MKIALNIGIPGKYYYFGLSGPVAGIYFIADDGQRVLAETVFVGVDGIGNRGYSFQLSPAMAGAGVNGKIFEADDGEKVNVSVFNLGGGYGFQFDQLGSGSGVPYIDTIADDGEIVRVFVMNIGGAYDFEYLPM